MQTALDLSLNILLAGCCVLFVGTVLGLGLRSDDPLERMLRAAALFAGALVVLVSQVSGASYAQFSLDALGSARPGTGLAKAVSAILPGLVGVGMGYYITRSLQQSEAKAIRLMCFVGMLAAAQFVLLYGYAVAHRGVHLGTAALPNATFVVGIVLYAVFKVDTDKLRRRSRSRFQASSGSPLVTMLRGARNKARDQAGTNDPPSENPQRMP